jgi:inorganic pyrophosphatase
MSGLADIDDVNEFDLLEIQHFFEVYKALEPGKEVEIGGWIGRTEAEKEIETCRLRLLESGE